MERRFLILSIAEDVKFPTYANITLDGTIIESELRRRFIEATQAIQMDPESGDMTNWHEVRDILLTGRMKPYERETYEEGFKRGVEWRSHD